MSDRPGTLVLGNPCVYLSMSENSLTMMLRGLLRFISLTLREHQGHSSASAQLGVLGRTALPLATLAGRPLPAARDRTTAGTLGPRK